MGREPWMRAKTLSILPFSLICLIRANLTWRCLALSWCFMSLRPKKKQSGVRTILSVGRPATHDTLVRESCEVYTKDVSRALRVVRALEAGRNCISPDGTYELPFGGWKASGIRSQKGSSEIFEFTQGKSVYINHSI